MHDFLKEVFPDYHPQGDAQASLKFALATLATKRRFAMLRHLLEDGNPISEISDDDAGWLLSRRESNARPSAYEAWPSNAKFRAYVDPRVYALAYPMAFFTGESFARVAAPLLNAARAHYPQLAKEIDAASALLLRFN